MIQGKPVDRPSVAFFLIHGAKFARLYAFACMLMNSLTEHKASIEQREQMNCCEFTSAKWSFSDGAVDRISSCLLHHGDDRLEVMVH